MAGEYLRTLGHRVPASIKTDDGQKSAQFDAYGWFERADAATLLELHRARYRGECADALAYHAAEEDKNPAVKQVFAYLTKFKPKTPRGGIIGFEVVVKSVHAFRYLADKRPDLAAELFPDGEPE